MVKFAKGGKLGTVNDPTWDDLRCIGGGSSNIGGADGITSEGWDE